MQVVMGKYQWQWQCRLNAIELCILIERWKKRAQFHPVDRQILAQNTATESVFGAQTDLFIVL